MAQFKIVQTMENGELKIAAVPSTWEKNGILMWPPGKSFKKSINNFKDAPGTVKDGWGEHQCVVKRRKLSSLTEALREIDNMSNNSDTCSDMDTPKGLRKRSAIRNIMNADNERLNFNEFCSQDNQKSFGNINSETKFFKDIGVDFEEDSEEEILQESPSLVETNNFPSGNSLLLTILENQNKHAVAIEHVIKVQSTVIAKLEKLEAQKINTSTKPSAIRDVFKKVDSIDDCRDLEEKLRDTNFAREVQQYFGTVCLTKNGLYGDNVAYAFVDHIFTRRFFTLVTWTGLSRTNDLKACFQKFERIFDFFFDLVRSVDQQYTTTSLKDFFQKMISNSKRRFEQKNQRLSRVKIRTRVKREPEFLLENETRGHQHQEVLEDEGNELNIDEISAIEEWIDVDEGLEEN